MRKLRNFCDTGRITLFREHRCKWEVLACVLAWVLAWVLVWVCPWACPETLKAYHQTRYGAILVELAVADRDWLNELKDLLRPSFASCYHRCTSGTSLVANCNFRCLWLSIWYQARKGRHQRDYLRIAIRPCSQSCRRTQTRCRFRHVWLLLGDHATALCIHFAHDPWDVFLCYMWQGLLVDTQWISRMWV